MNWDAVVVSVDYDIPSDCIAMASLWACSYFEHGVTVATYGNAIYRRESLYKSWCVMYGELVSLHVHVQQINTA